MSKNRLFATVSIAASSFAVWLYIVTQMQPNLHDIQIVATFFIALIIWVGCLVSFLLYRSKVQRGHKEIIYAHLKPSIRQGFLIAATIGMLLFLQLLRVLSIWDTVLVILVPIFFEIALRQSGHSLKGHRG